MSGLTEMPKVGEKVQYIGGNFNDYVTLGQVYEITDISQGRFACFTVDAEVSGRVSRISPGTFDCFNLVTERER